MDAPRHTQRRRVVSGAFTPRRLGALVDDITTEAQRIVDEFVESGAGDAIADLAIAAQALAAEPITGVGA